MKPAFSFNGPIVDIQHATVCRGLTPVLNDISLKIPQGQSTVILGPNGSGKSTLMKLFSRELYPVETSKSSVRLFGKDSWNLWDLRSELGMVSADLHADQTEFCTGFEVVLSGFFSSNGIPHNQTPSLYQRAKGYEVMESLGLAYLTEKTFSHMSTGEQHRILLARALVHDPHTLFFDEPTTGLDVRSTYHYLGVIREFVRKGGTVILATHHIHEIPPEVERVIFLKNGEIRELGRKSDLLTPSKLSELFDTSLGVAGRDGWYQIFPEPIP